MKSLLLAISASIVVAHAYDVTKEQAPAGSLEKIVAAVPKTAYATPAKPRKLLVISRTNGFRHTSIPTGKIAFTELGAKTGAFEAVVSEDMSLFEKDQIQQFDAICLMNITQNIFAPFPEELKTMSQEQKAAAKERELRLKANLMAFIKEGGGFVGIHGATDAFYEWPEYGEMINAYFDGHPWTADKKVSISVEPGQENHPLTKMFDGKPLEITEEIYQFKAPYDSSKVHMLLRLNPEKSHMDDNVKKSIHRADNDFGVAWARHWGKGRMFYSSLGHNHEIFWHPQILQHFLAGTQWALGDLKADLAEGK